VSDNRESPPRLVPVNLNNDISSWTVSWRAKRMRSRNRRIGWRSGGHQALKLEPQPQEEVALGFWKTNPRPMISSLKSIMVPLR